MPPLSQLLRTQSLPGFEKVDNPPTIPVLPAADTASGMNPYLRCPLPPFSTTVDTIRQWNLTGKNPVMRVIPLPTQQGAGGGASTSVTNITTTSSGGSGGTTPVAPLSPVTVFFNFPFLGPGATFQTVLKMSKSFQPLQLRATQPVEVRAYSNPVTQITDIARMTDLSVSFDNIEGIITDIVFDQYPFFWEWENRIGANGDTPQTTNVYVTVVNPSQSTGVITGTVTLVYLPLES